MHEPMRETELFIDAALWIEVEVQVNSFLALDHFSCASLLLGIIPLRRECLRIEADVLMKILPVGKEFAADLVQVFPNQFQVAPSPDKELVVMFQ